MSAIESTELSSIDPEEQARADLYALLSRLFVAPPDEPLLRALGAMPVAVGQGGGSEAERFAQTLQELVDVAASAQQEAVADEYQDLFVGSGRAEVSLYAGAYSARSSVDTPLVALRDFLSSQGIQRRSGVHEPEDHVATLLEIMRFLIVQKRSEVETQRLFFETFLYDGGVLLCNAISAHSRAQFYRPAAQLMKNFLLVEQDAFDM